jgi:hypothetical protein
MPNERLDAPKCQRSGLRKIEEVSTHLRHVVPPGIDWRAPLATNYWRAMLPRVNPGDRIDVATPDFGICYQLLVREVIDRCATTIWMTGRIASEQNVTQ